HPDGARREAAGRGEGGGRAHGPPDRRAPPDGSLQPALLQHRVDDAAERHGADAQAPRGRLLTVVAVVGSTGQLGSDLVEAFTAGDARVQALAHEDLDIGDGVAVGSVLGALRPDVVVNTAAFHNVPRCETEPERAYALNAVAPRRLARTCTELGARLVNVSTDYVFDGAKSAPYVETVRPLPPKVSGV